MSNYPLSTQIEDLHTFTLAVSDSILELKEEITVTNKMKVESYLLVSHFMTSRFVEYFNDYFDTTQLIKDYNGFRLRYFQTLNTNISTEMDISSLLKKRESIYNFLDARKQESIVDVLGPQAKYLTIKPEHQNPNYEKVKDNPLHQLITKMMRSAYQNIKGLDSPDEVIDYDFQKWAHFASQSIFQLTYLIYESPLSDEIKSSNDYNFIYPKFVIGLSNSLNGISLFCDEVQSYLK